MQISECATEVKTMAVTRTHFTFRVDTWTADGESIVEHVAGVEVARSQFPQAKVPLKKFGEVAKLNPLRSRNCLAPKKFCTPEITCKVLMNEIAMQNLILNRVHKGTIQMMSGTGAVPAVRPKGRSARAPGRPLAK
jgi:hypothetical protein